MIKMLFLLLLPTIVLAQKDTNLPTWEGDIILPYYLGHIPQTIDNPFPNYGCDFLKYTIEEENLGDVYFGIFRNRLFELIANKKLNCFYDAQLTKPLKKALADNYSFDSGYKGCLGNVSEEYVAEMIANENAARTKIPLAYCYPINTFLIKQHFKYFATTQSIESEIIAIAPAAVTVFKPMYDYKDFKPIFWVKNLNFTNNLDRNAPENTFVMRVVHTDIPDTLAVAGVKTGESMQQLRKFILENLKNKSKQPIFKRVFTERATEKKYILSQKSLDSIFMPLPDTTISYQFLNGRNDEVMKIIQRPPINADSLIHAVALSQILLFDIKTGALAIENSDITPLRTVNDEGKFSHYERLFVYPISFFIKKLKPKK
jgi:hypothetical protein